MGKIIRNKEEYKTYLTDIGWEEFFHVDRLPLQITFPFTVSKVEEGLLLLTEQELVDNLAALRFTKYAMQKDQEAKELEEILNRAFEEEELKL